MPSRDNLMQVSAFAVGFATVLNRIFLAACVLGLLASFLFPGFFADWLGQSLPPPKVHAVLIGMRLEILLGIAMGVAADRLLVPLALIVASVRQGNPFILANARRLHIIGWWLLILQLLDFPATLIGRYTPYLKASADHTNVSIGGWIAVLMVFVLSRIFAAGSAMRDDLEGTV